MGSYRRLILVVVLLLFGCPPDYEFQVENRSGQPIYLVMERQLVAVPVGGIQSFGNGGMHDSTTDDFEWVVSENGVFYPKVVIECNNKVIRLTYGELIHFTRHSGVYIAVEKDCRLRDH